MELYQNAVEIAQMEQKWLIHPNKNRKYQKIQLIQHLENNGKMMKKKEKEYKKELKLQRLLFAMIIKRDMR